MAPFQKDSYDFGVKRELEVLPFIEQILGNKVIHDKDTFNDFDFYTDEYNIELKSRTINSDCFETTFTTPQKRNKANNSKKKVLWLFGFTDGIYYLLFDEHKETINNLKINAYNTRYGERENINIPIKLLKPFSKNTF